jgi:hypothetical protein
VSFTGAFKPVECQSRGSNPKPMRHWGIELALLDPLTPVRKEVPVVLNLSVVLRARSALHYSLSDRVLACLWVSHNRIMDIACSLYPPPDCAVLLEVRLFLGLKTTHHLMFGFGRDL